MSCSGGHDGKIDRLYSEFRTPDYEKPKTLDKAIVKVQSDSHDPQLAWISGIVEKRRPHIIHDLGCGIGRFLGVLAEHGSGLGSDWLYVGIDSDEAVLSLARGVADYYHLAQQCVFLTPPEWEASQYMSRTPSLIVANDILHHMDHRRVARLLWILANRFPPDTSLVVGESGLFKRVERNRIPFSNSDLAHLGSLTGISVIADPTVSTKGLPLTRAQLSVPTSLHSQLSIQQIDDALKEVLLAKLDDLRSRLEFGASDQAAESEEPNLLPRVGMLEICQSVQSTLTHWDDAGDFAGFDTDVDPHWLRRDTLRSAFCRFLNESPQAVLYGDYGVGKTTLIRSIMADTKEFFWATAATGSAGRAQFVAWLLQQARKGAIQELVKACLAFTMSPDFALVDVLRYVPSMLLIIDNAHLCLPEFLREIIDSCLRADRRLLLLGSVPPHTLGIKDLLPAFEMTCFGMEETAAWLHNLSVSPSDNEDLRAIWENCKSGNPQLLRMRFQSGVRYGFPNSFGGMRDSDVRVISACLLQPEGLREDEIIAISKVSPATIETLHDRGLLHDAMGFYRPHDVVAQFMTGDYRLLKFTDELRRNFCSYLSIKYDLGELRDCRMTFDKCSDLLRLCNQLRRKGSLQEAWLALEAASYALYMDGDYDRILKEISECRKLSPPNITLAAEGQLFWLFMREGRIWKNRGQLSEAERVFAMLKQRADGREKLALLKEFAELKRRRGQYEQSVSLFTEAIALDKAWARDKRDQLITLKQLGVTLVEMGDIEKGCALLEQSMEGRDSQDRYGIASCRRYLALAGLRKLQLESHPDSKKNEIFRQSWSDATSALQQFEQTYDVEGIGGVVVIVSELARWGATTLGRADVMGACKNAIARNAGALLSHHKKDISDFLAD